MKVVVAVLASCLIVAHSLSDAQEIAANAAAVPNHKSSSHVAPPDISKGVVDTTIARFPTGPDLGPWEYSRALFLLGELSVYRRTHDQNYLAYAKAWEDSHANDQGQVDRPIDALDFIEPANVAISLYQQTGEAKYKVTADRVADVFKGYPHTSDGGFWHAINSGREHQLWLDGTFMAVPFIIRQGALSGHSSEANAEAIHQLLVYGSNLRDKNGPLYFHAYDESGKAPWADPVTHQSHVKWGRAIGWYCIALVDLLDVLPESPATAKEKAERQELIAIVQNMARDLVATQDPATGLWFQIIDKPKLEGNFLETSSSSMFTYFLDVAVKRGYIDASYKTAMQRGYRGVLSKVVVDADGHYHINDICEGTNVGDQASYLARKHGTDDFHGLGAFLLMNEEVQFNQTMMQGSGAAR